MLERVRSKTVHHKRLSGLLTKSTMAVSGIHKNFDLKIMTNVQEIQQENGCDEETALMCYGYSTKALQCIFQRLLTFMSKYKMWPQSLVITLVHTRQELTEKFGEDTETQSQILKIIGRILIHEYVSPMFKDQREMDEEYLNQSEDPLSANDRANLKLISKYLEMAAEGCGAFPDNNTTEEVLKEILWDTWVSLRDLFDEISRPRAVDERHITLDSAMMPQKLWMTPSNLCTAQELLLRHLVNMGLAENDPLKSTLTALPDINTIRCEENRKSLWFTTIYELGLLPTPNAQSSGCMTPAAQMVFSQVKAQMVTLLANSSVDTVRDLVSMPITPQMEERFHQESLHASDPVFVFSRNSWQTLSNDSDPDSVMSSTTSGEKSKGSTRGSVESAVEEDTTIAGKTLLEIQESLRNGLTQLHSAGCFGTGEEYQMLVDELAKDILSMPLKRERIEDMQFSLREVKAKMDALRIEKRQLAVYSTNSSSEQCVVPKKKKKSLMSKSAKHPYGYIKMSASNLIDMGIITHISGLGSMPKSKRLKCKIYSDEMGVYVFKLSWLPKGFQYKKTGVEVRMEDLLRSCIDSTRMEASSGPIRYRTDLMLQFLKAEFLTHTDRESNQ
ncbi:hypothetical protein SARC_10042 [Sphaeroforma arctica JP610]|uniref:RasGAP protein C-terminal domain-containing protein n=1 Tax=Sphaeroforma arctica JP610 TaxID=667725 RepID=A0A0L0FL40_9EUKA|nr:hypothetical protein SARC_10042 [Sphaeroforma arctica JP610]KNC77499.1 hypothetical protein SARC_10042 [Sphaeroforma arctica JP610]|eukprot:XP_014151401.1 hypothetical protein SARC_10042 [Sphaeroforma arctica JP610]